MRDKKRLNRLIEIVRDIVVNMIISDREYNRVIAMHYNELGYCYSARNIAKLTDIDIDMVKYIIRTAKRNGTIPFDYKYTENRVDIEECEYLHNLHKIEIVSLTRFFNVPKYYIKSIINKRYDYRVYNKTI